jgi:hypothetical protein
MKTFFEGRLYTFAIGVALLLIAQGCGSPSVLDEPLPGQAYAPAPQPPPFLTGAIALLLTNQPGFSARATLMTGGERITEGELLGRSPNLWFAPDFKEPIDQPLRKAGISFIWRTAAAGGFVLSEPLQGFAPISARARYTNVVAEAAAATTELVENYPCIESRVRALAPDGSETILRVWNAVNLSNFPVRMATTGTNPTTLTLSRVRFELPSADLFEPPEGFTRYPNAEQMMSEQGLREQFLRRRR